VTGRQLLRLRELSVSFGSQIVVDGVSLTLSAGECLALVGESGSGKTLTARALLGLLPDGAAHHAQELELAGVDARALSPSAWRRLRGSELALVSQDALVSLDPLRRVGAEVAEPLEVHGDPNTGERMPRAAIAARVTELLTRVAVPEPVERARQYPHQLSGGLRQRALIASALAGAPGVLIADEPTTALDVTVQAQVLELLATLKSEGLGVLLISHDLAVVSQLADRVAVMRAGRIVEEGSTLEVLTAPRHEYTRGLLAAAPRLPDWSRSFPEPVEGSQPHGAPSTSSGSEGDMPPILRAVSLGRDFRREDGGIRSAVADVSFEVHPGEAVGIVGESGSGKTTLARMLLGFDEPSTGSVELAGSPWSGVAERHRRSRRGDIQFISQDPLGSFDPRYTVARIIGEALRGRVERANAGVRVRELLNSVGLDQSLDRRRPHQLSGGQRQRVAIARALATEPSMLVCDEPVSALDVSIQATILELLDSLRRDLGVALVFVSHDLAVVAQLCDTVLVMKDGRVVERGRTADVFADPQHPFTRALIAAVPRMP
jgi:peptide/nickel transport system ATP-binding protein